MGNEQSSPNTLPDGMQELTFDQLWDPTNLIPVKINPIPEDSYENMLVLGFGVVLAAVGIMLVASVLVLPATIIAVLGPVIAYFNAVYVVGAPKYFLTRIGEYTIRPFMFFLLTLGDQLAKISEEDLTAYLSGA